MLKHTTTAAVLAAAGLALGASSAQATVTTRALPGDGPFKTVTISDEAVPGKIRFTFTPKDGFKDPDSGVGMGIGVGFFDLDADGKSDASMFLASYILPTAEEIAYGMVADTEASTTDCQAIPIGEGNLATAVMYGVQFAALGDGVAQVDVPAAPLGSSFDMTFTGAEATSGCLIDEAHPGFPVTFADAIHFTVLAPETTDNVPTSEVDAPVPVTLTATGAAGVEHTYYETGTNPAEPTTASAVYDPAHKPVLADGEKIRYFSDNAAGATETPKTSAAVRLKTPTPAPPAGPAPQLRLDIRSAAKQLLTDRHDITALAGCGPTACTLALNATVKLPGERTARKLTTRPKTLPAGTYQRVEIPSSLALRRAIRATLKRHPDATLRLNVTATATTPNGTATTTKTVAIRRLTR